MNWKQALVTSHRDASAITKQRREAWYTAARAAEDARKAAQRLTTEADRLAEHIAGMDIERRAILDPSVADQDKAARRLVAHDAARAVLEARLEEARRLASQARNAASDATALETRARDALAAAQAAEEAADPAGYGIEPLADTEVPAN